MRLQAGALWPSSNPEPTRIMQAVCLSRFEESSSWSRELVPSTDLCWAAFHPKLQMYALMVVANEG
jgi:hypothetical protein